MKEALKEKGQS